VFVSLLCVSCLLFRVICVCSMCCLCYWSSGCGHSTLTSSEVNWNELNCQFWRHRRIRPHPTKPKDLTKSGSNNEKVRTTTSTKLKEPESREGNECDFAHTRQHEPLGSSESWQNRWYTVTEVEFLPEQQRSTTHGTSYWPAISPLQLLRELQWSSSLLLKSNNLTTLSATS